MGLHSVDRAKRKNSTRIMMQKIEKMVQQVAQLLPGSRSILLTMQDTPDTRKFLYRRFISETTEKRPCATTVTVAILCCGRGVQSNAATAAARGARSATCEAKIRRFNSMGETKAAQKRERACAGPQTETLGVVVLPTTPTTTTTRPTYTTTTTTTTTTSTTTTTTTRALSLGPSTATTTYYYYYYHCY